VSFNIVSGEFAGLNNDACNSRSKTLQVRILKDEGCEMRQLTKRKQVSRS